LDRHWTAIGLFVAILGVRLFGHWRRIGGRLADHWTLEPLALELLAELLGGHRVQGVVPVVGLQELPHLPIGPAPALREGGTARELGAALALRAQPDSVLVLQEA
jgi:hypothetical protein